MTADHTRTDITHAHRLAATAVSAVGMSLGMWAGRGAWASVSDAARDKAGIRALAELDTAIGELAAVRDRLAAAVEQGQPLPGEREDGTDPGPDRALLVKMIIYLANGGSSGYSTIQRTLRIGLGKVRQLLDLAESWGVVGPASGSMARHVLLSSSDEFRDVIERIEHPRLTVGAGSPAPAEPRRWTTGDTIPTGVHHVRDEHGCLYAATTDADEWRHETHGDGALAGAPISTGDLLMHGVTEVPAEREVEPVVWRVTAVSEDHEGAIGNEYRQIPGVWQVHLGGRWVPSVVWSSLGEMVGAGYVLDEVREVER